MDRYLEFFHFSAYISRVSRTDRREAFERRAEMVGLKPHWFKAVEVPKEEATPLYEGHIDITRAEKIGCSLSHQEIIRYAKEHNFENVLIFEDDCLFYKPFRQNLQRAVCELNQFEWDILYLGGEPNNIMHQVSENLYTMNNQGGIYCLHAYAVHQRFYDKILAIDAYKMPEIDVVILNMMSHYRRLYATRELLAVQDYTFSDLRLYMTDSEKLMVRGWDKYITNGIKL